MDYSALNYIGALPLVAILFGITMMLIVDLFGVTKSPWFFTTVGVSFCVIAWTLSASYWFLGDTVFGGGVSLDPFTFFFYTVILGGTAASLLLNSGQLEAQRVRPTVDVDVLVLLAACGAMVMVSTANLIVLFLGFEILSVAVYVLSGCARGEKASAEGSLKYFIMGAFSSAFLLYGIALVFGATGSVVFSEIQAILHHSPVSQSPIFLAGLALLIFGFAFKVGAVPFHFWTPDAYQGAPVSITTFMAVVVKAAAFGALIRLLAGPFAEVQDLWVGAVALICGLTMTIGNIVALRQKSIKRMLAYSSIAHAGYILLGVVAGGQGGWEAALYYIVVYSMMTIASFGIVLICTAGTKSQYLDDSIDTFRGIGWRHPLLALAMSVAMLSLAGMPPFAGFFGKFYLFSATIRSGYIGLTILAALNSLVSLYYYLQVIVAMYFREPEAGKELPPLSLTFGAKAAISIATVAIIFTAGFAERGQNISRAAVVSFAESRRLNQAQMLRHTGKSRHLAIVSTQGIHGE